MTRQEILKREDPPGLWVVIDESVATGALGEAAVRDSKDPDGPVLVFTTAEWQSFGAGVKAGEAD
jgi:hypothetical protein